MEKQRKSPLVPFVIASFLVGSVLGGFLGGFSARLASKVFDERLAGKAPTAQRTSADTSKVQVLEEDSQTVTVVQNVLPSVVSIVITKDLSKLYGNSNGQENFPFGLPFGFQFQNPNTQKGPQEIGGGTGFVIREDGYIVTNKHVVAEQDANYTVIFTDGKKYEAKVLDIDPFNDIAILKIDATGLPAVTLGDSEGVKIGQTVIAIGNALGDYENTVTKGVVSGLGRTIEASGASGTETLFDVIQTDAAINPGNSGGPLLNLLGEVIGVNSAVDRQGEAVGFAIPVNDAKVAITSVLEKGKIVRPVLGVRYRMITPVVVEQNHLSTDHGALLVRGETLDKLAVIPGGPGDKAGLEEGDIILEFDGTPITLDYPLARAISKKRPGDSVELKVFHDGKEKQATVVLEEFE